MINLSDISVHFNKPIHEAAACLNITIQDLKKVCRANNLKRWPYNGFRKFSPRNPDTESPFQVLFIEPRTPNPPKKTNVEENLKMSNKFNENKTIATDCEKTILPSFSNLLESLNQFASQESFQTPKTFTSSK
jgi:hypothetical protein